MEKSQNLESQLFLRYSLYLFVVSVATYFFSQSDSDNVVHIIFFILIMMCISYFTLDLEGTGLTITASTAHVAAAAIAMIFSPAWAAWISALGPISREEILGRIRTHAFIYNRLQYGATAYISSWAFKLIASSSISDVRTMLAAAVAAATVFVVNVIFVAFYLRVQDKTPLEKTLKYFGDLAPSHLGVVPISYLLYVTYHSLGILGVLIFLIPIISARYIIKHTIDVKIQLVSTIRALMATLEARDENTFGHSDRVSRLAVEVAREMSLPESLIEKLKMAAILHDIGKIGIPDDVLNKPGGYTEEEYLVMAKHPIIGEMIISNSKLMQEIASWVRHHHERYDGLGWPDGLRGENIPLGARIIAVCDAFDAMTSLRPYRARLTTEQAMCEIEKHSGTQFDPDVVRALRIVVSDKDRIVQIMARDSGLDRVLIDLEPRQVEAVLKTYRLMRNIGRAEVEAAPSRDEDETLHGSR